MAINSQSNVSHPHINYALKYNKFKKGICHLCAKTNSNLTFCSTMYGSLFKVRYGPYIEKLAIEKGLTPREAENEARELKGFPRIGERWIGETMLYQYIAALFPDYEVLREASPDWLGQQRFDVYLPQLALAVEYQGQQHYKPVKLFGGSEGLKKTQQRDREKAAKCKANNVSLVLFTHSDSLNEKLVKTRLNAFSKYFS